MITEIATEEIHQSVLADECVRFLAPKAHGIYVDGTLGLGGHSLKILTNSSPAGKVIAFEWDEKAIELSQARLEPFSGRLTIVRRNFAEIGEGLRDLGIDQIDGLLIDIGLSSLQLDLGERGFTFQKDEPLDMRMDLRREMTAARLIDTCSEEELADIFFYYGEERQARPIAAAIVKRRQQEKLETTRQLVSVVSEAIPRKFHPKKIHVATKVFQALRIAVNGELENLSRILEDGVQFLKPGARFCVISFHSLEDRIVKRKFAGNDSLHILTKKPVTPTREELAVNHRSRSARLRVAEKRR